MNRLKFSRKGMRLGLIILIVLATVLVIPIRAEEEYQVIATLQAPEPSDFGGFGGDLGLSEDFLLIGEWWAYLEDLKSAGKAYIFDLEWSLVTTLQAPNPKATDTFSRSVDILGDIIVVGSTCNVGDIEEAGKVFIFNSEGVLLKTIQAPEPEAKAHFGSEMFISEDLLIVSEADKNVQGLNDIGVIHVYNSEGNYLRTLNTPSPKNRGAFGQSIDANDEFILVAEPGVPSTVPIDVGSVYVYTREYDLVETLRSPDNQERSFFGISVDISEDHVVIGERWASVDGHEKAGRAHIYDTDWNLVATLQSPTPEDNGEFGLHVAIGGGLVVVGERRGDVVAMNEGKAYVFDLEGNLIDTLVSPEPEVGAQFGWRVATDGEIVVVADVEHSVDGVSKAGKVHVFSLGASEVETPVETTVETTETVSEPEDTKSSGIPGFPIESVVTSVVIALIVLWMMKYKR